MMARGAQTQGGVAATVSVARSPADVCAAEIGLCGVLGGDAPLLAAGASLLELDARRCVLSACKPAQDGDGVVVRVLNPTDESEPVRLRFGLEVRRVQPVGLDEQPVEHLVTHHRSEVELPVPPHALRSVRVNFG
jgi:alpha-mannosidase